MGAEGFQWLSDLGIGLTQVARDGIQFDLGRVALEYRSDYAAEPEQTLPVTVSFTVGDGDKALAAPLSLDRKLELYPIQGERVLNLWQEEERVLSAISLVGFTRPAYNWRDKWPMGRAVFTHLVSDVVVRWGTLVPAGTEVVLEVVRKVDGEPTPASDYVVYVEDGLLPPEPEQADASASPEAKRPPLRDSEEIQGNVLAGFNKPHQEFFLVNFPDGAESRPHDWLRDLSSPGGEAPEDQPLITTTKAATEFKERLKAWERAQKQGDPKVLKPKPTSCVNLSVTFAGLCRLQPAFQGVGEAGQGGIDLTAFRDGAAARAGQLGAVDDNGPDKWRFGGADKLPVHAVLTIAADEDHLLDGERTRQRQLVEDHGLEVIGDPLRGDRLTGPLQGREHFGFREGISQPGVDGYSFPSEDHPGFDADHPGSRILPSEQFVFGRRAAKWLRDGSMQVFEQLAQDVAVWREQVSCQSGKYPIEEAIAPDLFAAKLVGRWPSGTSVADAPARDYRASYTTGDNDFTYDNDSSGERTPFCAHTRTMNPRDEESLAHRILRRGIPYGPPFEPGVEGRGADKERGLLFNAFVTSIKDQFEALLQAANDPAPQGPDALLGRPRSNDPFQVPLVGVEKPRKFSLEDFVQVKGVIYAFAPSIPVLRALAENRLDELGLDGS